MPLRDIRQYTLRSLSRGKKYTQHTEYKAMFRRGFWTEKEKPAAMGSAVTITRQTRTSNDLPTPCLELEHPEEAPATLGIFKIFIPVRFFSFPHTYWWILGSYSCFLFYLSFFYIHASNSVYTIFFQFWKISSSLTLAWWICFQMLICFYFLFTFLHLSNFGFEHGYH